MFTLKVNVHPHDTRHPLALWPDQVRTTVFGLKSIKNQCICDWNNLLYKGKIKESDWPFSKFNLRNSLKSYFYGSL